MKAETLPAGIWTRSDSNFCTFLPDAGRIISSAVMIARAALRAGNSTIAAWYRDFAPGEVEVRLRLTEDWRRNFYRMDKDTLWWRGPDGIDYPWKAVDPTVTPLPAWWNALLVTANKKMDRWEQDADT